MSVLDDLVIAGFSIPQAQAVIDEDTLSSNVDGLVAAGFTTTEALAIHGYDVSNTAANSDNIVQQGIWFGPALAAILEALAVTP